MDPVDIKKDSELYAYALISMRMDPYMFHQANANKLFDFGGRKESSPISHWVYSIVEDYSRYIKGLPIKTLSQDALHDYYKMRFLRDTCGIEGN